MGAWLSHGGVVSTRGGVAWGVGVSHLSKLPLPQLLPEAEEAAGEGGEGGAGGGAMEGGGASQGVGGASGDVSFSVGPRPHLGLHCTYGGEGRGQKGAGLMARGGRGEKWAWPHRRC